MLCLGKEIFPLIDFYLLPYIRLTHIQGPKSLDFL